MALKFANRVAEVSTHNCGTGTVNLDGAADGFQTFVDGVGNGSTCYYSIEYTSKSDGTAWEVGLGTITDASPDTLARTQVIASSTGAAINFGAASKTIRLIVPATTSGTLATPLPVQSSAFKLTTESGVPYSSADRSAQSTVYLTPVSGRGNSIWLYDTTAGAWFQRVSAEVSIALSGLTADKQYDVWASWSGSVALSLSAAWTTDTARADAITTQDGIVVSNGDKSKRLVGTIRTTSTTATEDSASKRFVWSMDWRTERLLYCRSTTDTYNYTADTWREAENVSTYGTSRVGYVVGLDEDEVEAVNANFPTNSGGNIVVSGGVGVDSTSANSSLFTGANASNYAGQQVAPYRGRPGLGFHFLTRLERSTASGTTTWYGDAGISWLQTGMIAKVKG